MLLPNFASWRILMGVWILLYYSDLGGYIYILLLYIHTNIQTVIHRCMLRWNIRSIYIYTKNILKPARNVRLRWNMAGNMLLCTQCDLVPSLRLSLASRGTQSNLTKSRGKDRAPICLPERCSFDFAKNGKGGEDEWMDVCMESKKIRERVQDDFSARV